MRNKHPTNAPSKSLSNSHTSSSIDAPSNSPSNFGVELTEGHYVRLKDGREGYTV